MALGVDMCGQQHGLSMHFQTVAMPPEFHTSSVGKVVGSFQAEGISAVTTQEEGHEAWVGVAISGGKSPGVLGQSPQGVTAR